MYVQYLHGEFPHLGEGWVVPAVSAAAVTTAGLLMGETVTVAGVREGKGYRCYTCTHINLVHLCTHARVYTCIYIQALDMT